jgi:hypothetical protein
MMPQRNGSKEEAKDETREETAKPRTRATAAQRDRAAETPPAEASRPGTEFARVIAENPIPVAAIWVGAGWLALKALSGGRSGTGTPPSVKIRETVDAATTTGAETVGQLKNTTQEVVGRFVGGAQGVFSTVSQEAPRRAEQVSTVVGWQAVRAQTTATRLVEENPLLLSAAAIAGGVALGLLAPTTRAESQTLAGPTKQLVTRAEAAASQAVDKVEQAVSGSGGSGGSGRSQGGGQSRPSSRGSAGRSGA